MDRALLEHFVALAEELHFRRAAERCHISQPTMSQQLRTLETELHVQLLHRTKRRVALTAAGAAFLTEARALLRQMDRAGDIARRTHLGEVGQLRIGATGSNLYVLLPEVVKRFRAKLPDVGLLIQQLTTADQEHALRNGDIDVGLVHPPLDDTDTLTCDLVASPPFTISLPATHPLAAKPVLRLEDLAGQPLILFPRTIGPKLYDGVIAACRDAGFSANVVSEAHPAQSIIALTAAEIGLGFIATAVQQHERDGVVYRPLAGPRPYLNVGVAYLTDSDSRPIATFRAAATAAGRVLDRARSLR